MTTKDLVLRVKSEPSGCKLVQWDHQVDLDHEDLSVKEETPVSLVIRGQRDRLDQRDLQDLQGRMEILELTEQEGSPDLLVSRERLVLLVCKDFQEDLDFPDIKVRRVTGVQQAPEELLEKMVKRERLATLVLRGISDQR